MRSYLALWRTFADEIKLADAQAVTTGTLMDFQRWLFYRPTTRNPQRGIASQNNVLICLKSFFAFLQQEGVIAGNPAGALVLARQPQTLPRNILTPQEARKIIETPDTGTLIGYRDRTIFEVLYATGIRKSELMNLTVADVNLEEELLRINGGKGAKDRVTPLTRVACSFLENYIKAIRPELLGKRQSDRLFISRRGRANGKKHRRPDGREIRQALEGEKARHLPPVAAQLRDAPFEESGELAPRPGNARPPFAGHDRALPAPDDHRLETGAPPLPSPREGR